MLTNVDTNQNELLIKWVIDASGKVWPASIAPEGIKYSCCACGQPLKRRGKGRPIGNIRHFSHIDKTTCSGETDIHRLTKLWIAHLLRENIGNDLALKNFAYFDKEAIDWIDIPSLPEYDKVLTERGLANGLRPDVSLWLNGQCVFGIEVRHKHPVDTAKAAALGIPWIEVLAEDDLDDNTAFMVVNGSADYYPQQVTDENPEIPVIAALSFETITLANQSWHYDEAEFDKQPQPSIWKSLGKTALMLGAVGLSAWAIDAAHNRRNALFHTSVGRYIRRLFRERTLAETLLGL